MYADYFKPCLILSMCVVGSAVMAQLYAAEPETDEVSSSDDYVFDSALFRGQSVNQSGLMQRLSQKQSVLAGQYKVDVYVNGHFVERMQLEFKDDSSDVQPCFQPEMLKSVGLLDSYVQTASQLSAQQQCFFLSQQVKGSQLYLDFSNLRLNLTIPQSELRYVPRGYVNPKEWNAGSSIGFINYIANYYYNSYETDVTAKSGCSLFVSDGWSQFW